MDDLKSIVEYHEQVLRSLGNQIGQLVESDQKSNRRMDRLEASMARSEAFMARAWRLGVVAYRRERRRRQEEDRRLEEQRKRDRAEAEELRARDRAEYEARMDRIERSIELFLEGLRGSNGRQGSQPSEA